MTTPALTAAPRDQEWRVVHGPLSPDELRAALVQITAAHGLPVEFPHPDTAVVPLSGGAPADLTVRWRATYPPVPDAQAHPLESEPHLEILLDSHPAGAREAARLIDELVMRLRRHSSGELDRIRAHLPLIDRYATTDLGLECWALIFRDHYVENTLGFLLAIHRAGIPASRIYALAKGDRTQRRDRVHATLLAHGIASAVLDNTAINAPESHHSELAAARAGVDAFIDGAHAAGCRVLVIDDGGFIAQGYGSKDASRRVDAAVELTVSGLKRIAAAGPLAIPVLNLARSELKTRLGYPEIADSCARRLRSLLAAHKIIGRQVLVIGFGELGSRLAGNLRAQGAQVHIVDTDPLALILAAESGYPTHRRVADALRATAPFLIVGTTGDDALTTADLALLRDDVFLAPFATQDFSLLATTRYAEQATPIPGIGRRYRLAGGHHATVLGDGRSLNLYEADAIPNQGYDAYRAGTLIATGWLCRTADQLTPGVHTEAVDDLLRSAGLYEAYYDTYLAGPPARDPAPTGDARTTPSDVSGLHACVVGYGVAGRLHSEILAKAGASLTILDPKHQDLPRGFRSFTSGIDGLPDAVASAVALWSICCPTADHLPVLRAILGRDPAARILLEKPACQGHEIAELTALLAAHRGARLALVDQYRHSRALDTLRRLIAELEPDAPLDHIGITFSKDRTADIARGRFVDRSYGVLGYEWLHMLTALRQFLPADAWATYLGDDPRRCELTATYDPRMFVSALTERSTLAVDGHATSLELASTITGSTIVLGGAPRTGQVSDRHWSRGRRPSDDRHRHITVHAGRTRFTAHLDPVTAPDGWQLDRNQHRITAHQDGRLLHDTVIDDSPLHTAVGEAVSRLLSEDPLPRPDLAPLTRIASLAQFLRAQQPTIALTAN
ncbi:S-adenosyl-L-homocysteine hydrolase, NAD binding domain [Parafrankia irregularis]|uniref:S-adenosyl-L-homocysteine hydrolase, NAD binding domain n=1 Tax=Parafrankia irregularis TaxID=795642 RepID=A0A0S4QYI5_9ACTN|nr:MULTISPECIES: hypothetical protein [Frankiaceae]MBE3204667.1 hypothetical protein [Parafrankia sp. CH37]CUU60605.1 S-adenosyl-L-homocysteine hydrolase, NAD binding domain [Parafrankia irregularis]